MAPRRGTTTKNTARWMRRYAICRALGECIYCRAETGINPATGEAFMFCLRHRRETSANTARRSRAYRARKRLKAAALAAPQAVA